MFQKILIANRGEIACRVIKTARRMGVATVAVYSDADAGAMHVAMADEAIHIGGAPARQSYLVAEKIIEAARTTGAQGIHPGYGFLSENPDFVEAVAAAGLTFIGPSANAIRAMGLKDAAKKLMQEAGVPVVPGYHGSEQDPGFLAGEADQIGYPVLIKASAGGGGKGMRRVNGPGEFADALVSAQREAEAAFGNSHVLIEKYVSKPRHIEVQVFGDGTRAVHLFERDCSLQRRHQKVIEEAPAPGMTSEMRDAMGTAAVRAAEAIGYAGAGTVEFIVDASEGLRADRFWFMEMNTRLQVEHPVTEAITGHDLVEWQLSVASGESLPVAQEDLSINGHAFEARIYAEDAAAGFLPQTGQIAHLAFPESARADTGVRSGDTITPFYDPMIAKLVVHGATREQALGALRQALTGTEVAGTVTNVAFLAALAAHEGFAAGDVDTGLIDRDVDALTAVPAAPAEARALAALAALGLGDRATGSDPWGAQNGFRLWGAARQTARLTAGEGTLALTVETLGPGRYSIEPEGEAIAAAGTRLSGGLPGSEIRVLSTDAQRVRFASDAGERSASVVRHGGHVTVFLDGIAHEFGVPDPLAVDAAAGAAGNRIAAPMTGLIKAVGASAGQAVSKGDSLIVMEAMKMEHTLRAPRDGKLASVSCAPGDQIEEGAVLIELEDEDG